MIPGTAGDAPRAAFAFVLWAALSACSAGAAGGQAASVDLDRFFRGGAPVEATFVLLDGETGRTTRYRPERARMRFRPASTFKIPNTLIALETGVATGPGFALPWDSVAAPTRRRVWARDQTLATAFRNSVYWFYQELARRIGPARMRAWMDRLGYGNGDIGGGIDRFWLHGDLRISPDEQVRFLRRLHQRRLPVSARSRRIVLDLMLLEDGDGYRLYGKTGTSEVTATRENGWIVGWAEVAGRAHFYALNMEGETVWEDWPPGERAELAKSILRELGVLPP